MTLSGTATVRAERTKLWTLAGVRWLLAATVVALVTMGAAIAATLDTSGCRGAGPGACAADPVKASLGGVWVAQVAVVVLGVLAMSTEYDTPQIRVTLAAMPRRVAVLLAKAGTVAALVAGVSGLGTVGALVAGRMVLAHNGFAAAAGPALSFTAGSTVRAAAGTVCYLVLVAVLALGLATLVREAAVGVVSVLALLYLFPLLGVAVNDPTWQHRLRHLVPSVGLGEDRGDIASREAGCAPRAVAEHRDLTVTVRQSTEDAEHDGDDGGIELVKLVLSTAVAGITPARRDPCDTDRGMTHTKRDTGIVDVPDPAASDDKRDSTAGVRHEPVGPGNDRAWRQPPVDRSASFHDGEAGVGKRDEPCVRASTDDAPPARVCHPRVLLVERRPIWMRVWPRHEPPSRDLDASSMSHAIIVVWR